MTVFEALCLKMFRSGMDTAEIAVRLRRDPRWPNITESAVYNALGQFKMRWQHEAPPL